MVRHRKLGGRLAILIGSLSIALTYMGIPLVYPNDPPHPGEVDLGLYSGSILLILGLFMRFRGSTIAAFLIISYFFLIGHKIGYKIVYWLDHSSIYSFPDGNTAVLAKHVFTFICLIVFWRGYKAQYAMDYTIGDLLSSSEDWEDPFRDSAEGKAVKDDLLGR